MLLCNAMCSVCCRLRLEAETLQEQLLHLFLAHPHIGVTVTDQQRQRVVLQLPQVRVLHFCFAVVTNYAAYVVNRLAVTC